MSGIEKAWKRMKEKKGNGRSEEALFSICLLRYYISTNINNIKILF